MKTNAFREEAIADHKSGRIQTYIAGLLQEFRVRFDDLHDL